eukprot:NODE_364_length_10092_cov_0.435905.p6 type:complete len:157 gc:universal NODE_364_length_10092_cov_0.435905:5062-4592(-)
MKATGYKSRNSFNSCSGVDGVILMNFCLGLFVIHSPTVLLSSILIKISLLTHPINFFSFVTGIKVKSKSIMQSKASLTSMSFFASTACGSCKSSTVAPMYSTSLRITPCSVKWLLLSNVELYNQQESILRNFLFSCFAITHALILCKPMNMPFLYN